MIYTLFHVFRSGYIVNIPVLRSLFGLLPKELQRGQPIKIVPVLFTIGINEQATLAEKLVVILILIMLIPIINLDKKNIKPSEKK